MLVTLYLETILNRKYANISMTSHPTKFHISGPNNSLDNAKWKLARNFHSVVKFLFCTLSTKYYLIEYSIIFYSLLTL